MKSKQDKSRYAEALGIDLRPSTGDQRVGECPFCGKPKFHISQENGCWDCKTCGEVGNPVVLMTKLIKLLHEDTSSDLWRALSDDRGIPVETLKRFGLADNGDEWLLPCRNPKGNIVSVNRWCPSKKKAMRLPGISAEIFNANALAAADRSQTVYLCEGEWDVIALTHAIEETGRAGVAVGLPGVATFKAQWSVLFEGRDMVIAFDNDEPGRRAIGKAVKRLERARSIKVVKWPDDLEEGYDVRDLVVECGEDFQGALERLDTMLESPLRTGARPAFRVVADVEEREVEWLWPDRIPLGKLTLIGGDPGLGKSFLTLDIAARVSAGLEWPDSGEQADIGGVVLLSAEDDVEDTIRPRLRKMSADLERVVVLDGIHQDGSDCPQPFALENHLRHLEQLIEERTDVRLVVIDPIDAFLGASVDSYKSADVRRVLAPLATLAARRSVAVVAVTHLNKNTQGGDKALYRMLGSIALPAAARMVWAVMKDDGKITATGDASEAKANDRDEATLGTRWQNALTKNFTSAWRLFLPVKANLAPEGRTTGLRFRIRFQRVQWSKGEVQMHADEAMNGPNSQPNSETPEADRVEKLLRDLLTSGIVPAKEIVAKCKERKVASKTRERVKKSIGIVSRQNVIEGKTVWFWGFPEQFSNLKENAA